jgi:hypothetical protein|uniref:Uncharacterized protein n=1 Tax=Picea glauca TaxID=3330 RepID=A0A101LWR6_PICGL|nr:hypothetical protein ABT39_MTgene1451 [Picea glauca]
MGINTISNLHHEYELDSRLHIHVEDNMVINPSILTSFFAGEIDGNGDLRTETSK